MYTLFISWPPTVFKNLQIHNPSKAQYFYFLTKQYFQANSYPPESKFTNLTVYITCLASRIYWKEKWTMNIFKQNFEPKSWWYFWKIPLFSFLSSELWNSLKYLVVYLKFSTFTIMFRNLHWYSFTYNCSLINLMTVIKGRSKTLMPKCLMTNDISVSVFFYYNTSLTIIGYSVTTKGGVGGARYPQRDLQRSLIQCLRFRIYITHF